MNPKLTAAQRRTLADITRHEHDAIPVRAYGKSLKPLYALKDAGLAMRQSDGRWVPTDAGRAVGS